MKTEYISIHVDTVYSYIYEDLIFIIELYLLYGIYMHSYSCHFSNVFFFCLIQEYHFCIMCNCHALCLLESFQLISLSQTLWEMSCVKIFKAELCFPGIKFYRHHPDTRYRRHGSPPTHSPFTLKCRLRKL